MEKLLEGASERLKNKLFVFLRDLLLYDDKLHCSFNDLSAFSNTSNIQPKKKEVYDLSYDPNKEEQEKNEKPENKEFRGSVHRFLEARKEMFGSYLAWLKDRIK